MVLSCRCVCGTEHVFIFVKSPADVPGVSWCGYLHVLCSPSSLYGLASLQPSPVFLCGVSHPITCSLHRKRLSRSDPTLDLYDSRSSVYNPHLVGRQDQASLSASSLPVILHDELGLSLVSELCKGGWRVGGLGGHRYVCTHLHLCLQEWCCTPQMLCECNFE